jgi:LmbE family N-acetylglucosaminyl deacetylase
MPLKKDQVEKDEKSILAVYAHPDDESFVPGGTIARYAFEGVKVTLVCATRGEEGMLGDPPLADRASLGECREDELLCSCRVLGVDRICFLDFIDSRLSTYPHPDVEGKIVEIVRTVKPQVVITFGSEGITGHPDHAAISHFTTDAFFDAGRPDKYPELKELGLDFYQPAKLYYSVLPKSLAESLSVKLKGVEEDKITAVIDVSRYAHIKKEALFCHRTQLPDFMKFNEEDFNKIFTLEYFSLVYSNLPHQKKEEEDLFEGLR